MKIRRNLCLVALSCMVLAGCYRKVAENGGLVFSFQPWVPFAVGIAGLLAIPGGIMLFMRHQRLWGVILAIVGAGVAFAVAPGMYLDRVIVNQEEFYSRHGYWWSPTIHQIRYSDLNQVQVVVEEKIGRRGRKSYSYYFDCTTRSGKKDRVPLGDIMREALPEIAAQFRKHGVPVHIPPNLPE